MRRLIAIAMVAAAPHGTVAASPAPATFETGVLTIGGEVFAPSEILDARALPDINGKVGMMLTLSSSAAKRLEGISGSLVGKPMLIALDGRPLAGELIRKPIVNGVIEIPGRWTLTDGETLARRISGKDPLPDDLAE